MTSGMTFGRVMMRPHGGTVPSSAFLQGLQRALKGVSMLIILNEPGACQGDLRYKRVRSRIYVPVIGCLQKTFAVHRISLHLSLIGRHPLRAPCVGLWCSSPTPLAVSGSTTVGDPYGTQHGTFARRGQDAHIRVGSSWGVTFGMFWI